MSNITGNEKSIALNLWINVLLVVCLCITMKWLYDQAPRNRYYAAIVLTNIKKFNPLEVTLVLKQGIRIQFFTNYKWTKNNWKKKLDQQLKKYLCQPYLQLSNNSCWLYSKNEYVSLYAYAYVLTIVIQIFVQFITKCKWIVLWFTLPFALVTNFLVVLVWAKFEMFKNAQN